MAAPGFNRLRCLIELIVAMKHDSNSIQYLVYKTS